MVCVAAGPFVAGLSDPLRLPWPGKRVIAWGYMPALNYFSWFVKSWLQPG